MSVIYKWQIYCETEGKFVSGYGSSEPNMCYNDHEHTINPSSVQQLEQYSAETVLIQDEKIPTGGHFKQECFTFDCPPSSIHEHTLVFPYDITLFSIVNYNTSGDIGNSVDFYIPLGDLGTWSMGDDSRSLILESEKLGKLFIGAEALLYRDDVGVSLGKIIDIYTTTNVIEVENALPEEDPENPQKWSLKANQNIIEGYDILDLMREEIKFSNFYGMFIQKNTKLVYRYYNNSEVACSPRFALRYNY